MNAATVANEFDVGPLTWVKSEIDLALERADAALQQYTASVSAGAGDLTQIKFCRTHLHQVQGALTIVGLDGVTQFAEAVESLLDDLEQQKRPLEAETIVLAQKALVAVTRYLDDLIGGQPNQPLRLLPLYREVLAARGIDRVAPSDLFFPDLNVRPPRRDVPARKLVPDAFLALLRQERARFQRGLLGWLRSPRDGKGIDEMLQAVRHIEDTQDAASARSFWWVTIGFFSALGDGAFADDAAGVKQMCARVDLQIRRLLEGSKNVAERLMRDVLYFVARADSAHPVVQQVRDVYQLQSLMPPEESAAPAPREAVRRKLAELITASEEAWSKYCSGSSQSLPVFKKNAKALFDAVAQLEHTDFRRLAQAIAAAANWLSDDSSRHSDALSMEVATAILLAQNAQENFQRLSGDFAHQVDVTVARIHGCLAGSPPQPESEIPLLDEMSRKAQEKLLIGHVAKEIQSNFAQIEQVLDSFFRDVNKRTDLAGLEIPFRQVAGALTMMRHDAAATAVGRCAEEIRRFADPEYAAQESDFEAVANQLSMIGFFIDSLQFGAADFNSFARRIESPSAPGASGASDAESDQPQVSVEQEVEQHKRAAHEMLAALREHPVDARLRQDLKQTLTTLKNDADLLADKALGDQAKAVLAALESGEKSAEQVDRALEILKPRAPEAAPPPSIASPAPATASVKAEVPAAATVDAEVDAELLGIFLEEAHEVLATIADSLRRLREQPHVAEYLTTIRRSFHTLKGSGRMVGLKDVGEAAWSIEQTLNVWLGQELGVAEPLVNLLAQAHGLFSAWVAYLESRAGQAPDPAGVVALSEALRRGAEERREGSVPQTALAAEPAFAGSELTFDNSALFAVKPAPVVQDSPTPSELFSPAEKESVTAEVADQREPVPVDSPPAAGQEAPDMATAVTRPAEPETVDAQLQPKITLSPLLFEIFFDEARTHFATLERELALLERHESSPTPHEMYRAAHTLAGISATVGLTSVNRLGVALEHALLRRDRSAHPESLEALGVVRQAIGELELVLASLADKRAPVIAQGLVESLDAIYPAHVVAAALAEAGLPAEAVDAALALPVEMLAEDLPEPAAATLEPQASVSALEQPPAEVRQLHDEIDEQLLPIFLEEAVELNRDIADRLRAWRNAPDDREVVRTLTRHLHTLKGSARMAGAMGLGELTHSMETRLDQASHAGAVSFEIVDEIQNDQDVVLQYIDELQHREPAVRTDDRAATAPVAGVSAKLGVVPGLGDEAVATAAPVVEKRSDPLRASGREVEMDGAAQTPTLRVRAELIDRLVNEAGELSISRSRIEGEMRSLKESLLDLTENVIRLRRQLREIEIHAESQLQSRSTLAEERHAGFDPLELDRFTRFQELTRMMAESVNDVGTVQQNLLKNLDDANAAIVAQARLNREVQQELMAVRMIPFGSLADRLYRIVRQTSKELDKRVNLEISGGQVELDRSVLDKIGAPLEHMLRNAIAHGIEGREIRRSRGKPEIGEITLGVKQEGNEIILSFADDGGGLDFARIRARAIDNGLLSADAVTDDARLADLIFSPGFSTAAELSQLAGRGVGMDVVKTEVSRLGGRIEVISTAGRGTEFRLYIPLTLAVTKALLVRAGNRKYAIPSTMIEQVLDLKEAALSRIRDAGEATWMEQRYPFSYLPQLLGEEQAVPEQQRQYWALLLKSGARRISVQVDQLLGNQEIVVKNIGPQLTRVVGVDGATVLGNGDVVLILNPVALSSRTQTAAVTEYVVPVPAAPQRSEAEAVAASLPTVMVVDDSLTVRKITGRLLAREGYQVILAKDGVEALELLLEVIPDVMVVDIEMPRMDGFELTRNLRAAAHLKDIPVIMITSRTADKHRALAFEIGVNHYLGKPYQEDELLQLVGEHVNRQRSA